MAIDRLSSTSALIASLRSDVLRRMDRAPRTAEADRARTGAPAKPSTTTRAELRKQLIDIVKDVDITDAEAVRQAHTRCVREILLWEFGPGFRDHPEWRALNDRIGAAYGTENSGNEGFITLIMSIRSQQ